MRPVGEITRGTTNPNRLRRVDNYVAYRCGDLLRAAAEPLVIDLGYGATPVTAVELRSRLAASVRPDVTVVGLEIDPVRVEAAQPHADPPHLVFRRGGFELAGLRPTVVRAFNVLRQYAEEEVAAAWTAMTATGAVLVEGTCDELGRIATWAVVEAGEPGTLTFSARLSDLDHPATFAERLPKSLIHHNVPGEPVHTLLQSLGRAWETEATPFGPRQRWLATCRRMRAEGWPVLDGPARWRLGELTVPYSFSPSTERRV
ncbi:class I SAM-dependent methyltransferase [Actinoplanes sp. LDG1-06]|uniref:Class I SAM-dependent methyltransferase n=1 Tax=Paractinoplanes ovalisporus TaxID=2810368 RepID=A0ABS2AC54_9ACTN|nr:class I SAM-dependent methyltransferase [Actinoplanes ovalisporus]MBM2617402.1 class I SAM-dependent methyltransferase [Actinoplanes ovalisporus]